VAPIAGARGARAVKIHAFIFCWPGQVESTRRLRSAVRPHVDLLTVIDSSGEALAESSAEWICVDRAFFYGRLFRTALEHFAGDVLLQIQSDASAEDWGAVIRACRRRFGAMKKLAIWAPEVDYTVWVTEWVKLYEIPDTGLVGVAQTDGIVSALDKDIVRFLKTLDYSQNNLGWGIDWAAIGYAFASGKLVLRDTTVRVEHPQGSGYGHDPAYDGQSAFLAQLPIPVALQCAMLTKILFPNLKGRTFQASL
jgi:hypothetical protein